MLSGLAIAENAPSIPLLQIPGAAWTDEEERCIQALHQRGRIDIATKISSAVYLPQPDGSIRGFHYNVFKAFADLAGIDIGIRLVPWNDYFYKAGEDLEKAKADARYAYVPTLIEQVDLYIDGITVLPWREKMFDIIKFVPSRQMIVSRKGHEPLALEDLDKKICAMVKDTSMELNLENIARERNIRFSYVYTEDFDAMDRMVAEDKADFTVYDSDRAFAACYHYPNLTIAMPISETEMMGWAINKDNGVLERIIEKYLRYAQETGILDKYWQEEYGVSFIGYLRILKLN